MVFKPRFLLLIMTFVLCQSSLADDIQSRNADVDIVEESTDDTPEMETEGSIDSVIDESIG